MNFVLFVLDTLNGQEKIINRFFTSEQEANQFCVQNDLIFSRVLSEQEYQNLLLQKQQERLLRQQYRRYQQPQPQAITTIQEQEPEEPPVIPRPPKPIFNIINPLKINPKFVTVNRRKR
jgi:hypothetical protein